MIRFLRRLILLVCAVVLVALMIANRHTVAFGLDPFARTPPDITVSAPMFVFLFAALLAGAVLGGIGAWMGQSKWRALARQRTKEAFRLRQDRQSLARDLHEVRGEAAGKRLPAR